MRHPFQDPGDPDGVLYVDLDERTPLPDPEVKALLLRQDQLIALTAEYGELLNKIAWRLTWSGEAKLRAQREASTDPPPQ